MPALKRLPHRSVAVVQAALLALAVALSLPAAQAQSAAPKPRVEKAADLPRFSYPLTGKLEDVVRQSAAFAPQSAALRRDTEGVLAGYDLPDKGTRRDLISLLAVLDYLDGQYASALARADEVRSLQDKPADRLLSVSYTHLTLPTNREV